MNKKIFLIEGNFAKSPSAQFFVIAQKIELSKFWEGSSLFHPSPGSYAYDVSTLKILHSVYHFCIVICCLFDCTACVVSFETNIRITASL